MPLKLLGEIYLIIEMIEEMVFQHMIRRNCLDLKLYFIFEVPFPVNREETFYKIRSNKRVNIQNEFPCFYLIDNK